MFNISQSITAARIVLFLKLPRRTWFYLISADLVFYDETPCTYLRLLITKQQDVYL